MASSGMPRTGTAIMVSGGSTSAAHSGSPDPDDGEVVGHS
jgi:hypothetical protein